MPSGSIFNSRLYRVACACSLALVVFVLARAPLWNRIMAGARTQVGSSTLALVPPAWRCTDYPYVCSTTVDGHELVARIGSMVDGPITCSATYRGQSVVCTPRLWYAPKLKPFLELGALPGVSFEAAMLERPWRLLDLGLLGEAGPLHLWAGCVAAFLTALAAGALIQRGGVWWVMRFTIASLTFVGLNGTWIFLCFLTGYID